MRKVGSTKTREYYWVVVKHDGRWTVEFGDYSRDVARSEVEEVARFFEVRIKDVQVVKGDDTQTWIDNWLARNNA